jgi:hypothetical protein
VAIVCDTSGAPGLTSRTGFALYFLAGAPRDSLTYRALRSHCHPGQSLWWWDIRLEKLKKLFETI